jgi:type II secretory pathway component PulM
MPRSTAEPPSCVIDEPSSRNVTSSNVATPCQPTGSGGSSARESGLAKAISGSQPVGDGGLRIQLEQADFNLLVAWLARLGSQHGLHIESATIDGGPEPGLVNAAVVIRLRK